MVIGIWGCRGLLELIPPVKRPFYFDDSTLQYPYMASIIPNWLLLLLALVFPFIVILVVKRKDRILYASQFLICVGIIESLTTILKVMVGRLRPFFIEICAIEYPNELSSYKHPLYTGNCLNESKVVDGRKSFPSGHSSMSFCGLGYLSLVLYYQFYKYGLFAHLASCLPLVLAFFISISRTLDNHHHFEDVLVGIVLGSMGAIGFYTYFDKLTSKQVLPIETSLLSEIQLTTLPQD